MGLFANVTQHHLTRRTFFRSPGALGTLSLGRLKAVLKCGLPDSESTSPTLYNHDIFVDALSQILTQDVLKSWWVFYATSKAYHTLLYCLYCGLERWSALAWSQSSASLKLRIVLCFYIPFLEAMCIE